MGFVFLFGTYFATVNILSLHFFLMILLTNYLAGFTAAIKFLQNTDTLKFVRVIRKAQPHTVMAEQADYQ